MYGIYRNASGHSAAELRAQATGKGNSLLLIWSHMGIQRSEAHCVANGRIFSEE
jgi:hypothetical protein